MSRRCICAFAPAGVQGRPRSSTRSTSAFAISSTASIDVRTSSITMPGRGTCVDKGPFGASMTAIHTSGSKGKTSTRKTIKAACQISSLAEVDLVSNVQR